MKRLLPLALLLLLNACAPQPSPIDYGADACAFCRMTIVDQQHAAEVVTQKGRAYKFDAVECMVNYVDQQGEDQFALLLVTGYLNPGILTDARKATYLISEAIPSPMGAFLTAFTDQDDARAVQQESGGRLFNWSELQRHFAEEGLMQTPR